MALNYRDSELKTASIMTPSRSKLSFPSSISFVYSCFASGC